MNIKISLAVVILVLFSFALSSQVLIKIPPPSEKNIDLDDDFFTNTVYGPRQEQVEYGRRQEIGAPDIIHSNVNRAPASIVHSEIWRSGGFLNHFVQTSDGKATTERYHDNGEHDRNGILLRGRDNDTKGENNRGEGSSRGGGESGNQGNRERSNHADVSNAGDHGK